METTIKNILSCFSETITAPNIKHIDWCVEKCDGRYVVSILTECIFDTSGKNINMSCVISEKYFDYKKFREIYPYYEIDCWDYYHFIVYDNTKLLKKD